MNVERDIYAGSNTAYYVRCRVTCTAASFTCSVADFPLVSPKGITL